MLHAAVVNTSGGAGFAGPAGLVYLWFPNNTEQSKNFMIMELGFNNTVVMNFNMTKNFLIPSADGYVSYDANDIKTSVGQQTVHIVELLPTTNCLPALLPDQEAVTSSSRTVGVTPLAMQDMSTYRGTT